MLSIHASRGDRYVLLLITKIFRFEVDDAVERF